ncbi:T9SS type A sorting domain-containing protein [Hymenobacter elongatus]|uniref:T9SS type A sorting domain-containing protein n=1 Tax=Hymenobacter elongatus TaxID=877208 RepID=A0A4Z0PNZ8_9BACT|nr:T9SS type A sorting domain-containing protein [Hymenobacter elongatus]TGE17027.1 T9SS type A sorting domain-containing protein [Hymenobacter elongatus]
MTNWYKTSLTTQRWRQLALAALLSVGATAAQAQSLNYNQFGVQNIVTAYDDLGAKGTLIPTPNTDDANSAATPIGFTFNYNGVAFNDFVLNTNGFIKLGTTAPAAPFFSPGSQVNTGGPLNAAGETNLLLPFNDDLVDATAGPSEYRVFVDGTPGQRVCTIQWKNVKDKPRTTTATSTTILGTQLDNFSFQVKLYETSNTIDFVYSSAIAGAGPEGAKFEIVGIKGSGSAVNQTVVGTKGSATAWSATTFGGTVYSATTNAHNIRSSVRPDAGRTYRFLSAQPIDAAVLAVYSLGKLPIPAAAPHVIQAVVRNVGSSAMTNVAVTATVAGVNTFTSTKTIATLAVGAVATVSFDPFTPTVVGNETITVTAAADDVAANNTKTYVQQVTTGAFAIAEPGVAATSSIGFGASTTGNILAVKYTTNSPRQVTTVTTRLADPNSVGKIVYAVVTNSAGAILGRTPDYTVATADINTDKVFTLPTPVSIPAGDFYAGIAQGISATPHFPIGTQNENPTRPGAFYSIAIGGGAPGDQVAGNLGRIMIEANTIGAATCPIPTAVSVTSNSSTSGTVSFTGPASATGYTIIYGPSGFNPASAGTTVTATTSPFTITGLTPSTTYQVYIRSNCGATDQSALVGPATFATLCTPPIITTFPYTQNFDNIAPNTTLPCGITVSDANGDGYTWEPLPTNSASAPNSMVYLYNEADITKGGDDWFYTPSLFLRAGSSYQLSFKYKTLADPSAATSEKLEVKFGAAATPAGQTNLLWRNTNITNTTYVTTTAGSGANQVMAISPTANGNVFIGFHAFSNPNEFVIFVDDVAITSAVTGVSDALLQAVNVYPNPSAGEFTVEVRGANAKGAMQVEVTNLLGQRVHTATIRDNFENKINLSSLSNGMYTIKVKSGDEYMIRNIVVQK